VAAFGGSIVTRAMGKTPKADVSVLAGEIGGRLSSLGCPTAQKLRAIRREFSRRLKDAPPDNLIELAIGLVEAGRLEHRVVAYELLHYHPTALEHVDARLLERLGQGIASWGAVDCYASYISGPLWRERRVPGSLIHGWARSRDRWWRRAALVSTVPLNIKARGGKGDAHRTLQVCRMLERDRDPMITKALSWALRALATRDRAAVRKYLASREDVLPALVLREVRNKLTTGVKNPRKR
jgi:3-methyladenine DNA glycosylase AlkD